YSRRALVTLRSAASTSRPSHGGCTTAAILADRSTSSPGSSSPSATRAHSRTSSAPCGRPKSGRSSTARSRSASSASRPGRLRVARLAPRAKPGAVAGAELPLLVPARDDRVEVLIVAAGIGDAIVHGEDGIGELASVLGEAPLGAREPRPSVTLQGQPSVRP